MRQTARMKAGDEDELERLAAHLAHDFSNLLTGILGNLELLERRAARTGIQGLEAYTKGARQAAERAAELTQRLMVLSGRLAQPPQALQLAPLLRQFVASPAGQGIGLAAPPPETMAVRADPDELLAALAELACNAREAAGSGTLEVMTAAREVVITLRDAGPGMTPDMLARARHLFFTTHANGAGRGLGLGIAARIAKRAGGWLDLESAPGQGCAARLVLPLPGAD
ncbi:ATP-binding protein [Acidocella sp.]|uniref:ATP-binding protein n=1 Tax=Acidocella sp. TaxID=50710 RepID=UPI0026355693|nr:HAMP domain-containing sensor histidine kinase [Acidocella sp.]